MKIAIVFGIGFIIGALFGVVLTAVLRSSGDDR